MSGHLSRVLVVCAVLLSSGCAGAVRETTTARTPQEMLFLSGAAQRAVLRFDPRPLRGRSAWIVLAGVEHAPERSFVLSALRDHLVWHEVKLATTREEADVVVEARMATLGLYEGSWKAGIPSLPIPLGPGSYENIITPDFTYGYELTEGWAALEVFVIDARTGARVLGGPRSWGRTFKGVRNDIWPDRELVN